MAAPKANLFFSFLNRTENTILKSLGLVLRHPESTSCIVLVPSTANMTRRRRFSIIRGLVLIALAAACLPPTGRAFSLSSRFHGIHLSAGLTSTATLTMRKQKASDRRTRRMQRGEDVAVDAVSSNTITNSPMALAGWQHKTLTSTAAPRQSRGGRGRSRKRSNLYNTLSSYHGNFLSLLTDEYRAEVRCSSLPMDLDTKRYQSRFGAPNLSRRRVVQ